MWCDPTVTQQPLLDFRSDTVTKPDEAMRAAMASAEVADDVLEHDPTMRALEERVAGLLNTEAALWVPSGSMGNLIALFLHLRRGDRFLAAHSSHVLDNELGTAAWIAGGMPYPMDWDAGPGRMSAAAIHDIAGSEPSYHGLNTTLLSLENTHNAAGGTVMPLEAHMQLVAAARECRLRVHLDGARLWNASVALGVAPAELTVGVDTVQVCLSKGLGAPVGSIVAGTEEFVVEARRVRKMLGGGVRQGGILAAAGLVALDRVDDLADDHANAKLLAEGLTELGWSVRTPETNIVLAAVPDLRNAIKMLGRLGIQTGPMSGQVRFVTHRDLSTADVKDALHRIGSAS
ncbi:threonine aldolase family protein [Kutzneria kofuensis]|uniref:threonine aldolase family protein n=1 Tax=Kutzneria kofuensis TaxID=103725 RepID=UPI0016131E78